MDCRTSANGVLLEEIGHVHTLLVSLQDVGRVVLVELAQAFHDSILARCVDLFEGLLHLGLQLAALKVTLLDPGVLGLDQEAEVLAFFLKKAESTSPLDVAAVSLFLDLDNFEVEPVVFFGDSLVLLLQRH